MSHDDGVLKTEREAVVGENIPHRETIETYDRMAARFAERTWALPLAWSGAGIAEALYLSAVLAGSDGRVILLDEPALNLHPTTQATLSRVFEAPTDTSAAPAAPEPNQVLLVTHSPFLVPIEAITNVSRFALNRAGVTTRAALDATCFGQQTEQEKDQLLDALRKELRRSSDVRGLLFSQAVVLLEGETELGALPLWFGNTFERADIALYSVGGDLNFATYVRFLRCFGIPYAIICDGAVFDIEKKGRHHIFRQILDAGADIPALGGFLKHHQQNPMSPELFAQETALGQQHGIFTLAQGWHTASKEQGTPNDEGFEVFLDRVAPGLLDEAAREVGKSKVRQGRWVAEHVGCPGEVRALYEQLLTVLRLRGLAL